MSRPSVPIFPVKGNPAQLLRIYKIAGLAKYAYFRDFVKRGMDKAPFTLIGARPKPGLTSAMYQVFLRTFTARTLCRRISSS